MLCANFLHGVAFLRGFDTPSLPAQGEQRRSSYFNIRRGNPNLPCVSAIKLIPLPFEGNFERLLFIWIVLTAEVCGDGRPARRRSRR